MQKRRCTFIQDFFSTVKTQREDKFHRRCRQSERLLPTCDSGGQLLLKVINTLRQHGAVLGLSVLRSGLLLIRLLWPFHVDFAWLLGRTRVLSEDALARLRRKLSAAGVNASQLTVADQSGGDVLI